jgi:hypothetical protein
MRYPSLIFCHNNVQLKFHVLQGLQPDCVAGCGDKGLGKGLLDCPDDQVSLESFQSMEG